MTNKNFVRIENIDNEIIQRNKRNNWIWQMAIYCRRHLRERINQGLYVWLLHDDDSIVKFMFGRAYFMRLNLSVPYNEVIDIVQSWIEKREVPKFIDIFNQSPLFILSYLFGYLLAGFAFMLVILTSLLFIYERFL